MALQDAFRLSAKMEVAYISGVLRVRVEHGINVVRLLVDAVILAMVVWSEWGSWGRHTLFSKTTFILITIGALTDLVYQLTGSETVEFSPQGLKVQMNYFGWERVREFPIAKCSELSWRPDNDRKDEYALECKIGWRKIPFGKYLNETQAREALSELQRYLPEVAQKMGMSHGQDKSSHTRLQLG